MPFQFSVAMLAAVATVVALFVADLPFVLFLFALQGAIICAVVEMLVWNIPHHLQESSEVNCLRMDGSWSRGRAALEHRAIRRMRYELLAVFVLVALTGNWLAFFVHEIIPIPIAAKAMQLFDPDPVAWKQNLREQRVDQEFEQWSVRKAPTDRDSVQPRQELLWYSWPVVMFIGFVWMVGSWAFIKISYMKTLREFASGVSSRTESNLDRDIMRLQSEHDVR